MWLPLDSRKFAVATRSSVHSVDSTVFDATIPFVVTSNAIAPSGDVFQSARLDGRPLGSLKWTISIESVTVNGSLCARLNVEHVLRPRTANSVKMRFCIIVEASFIEGKLKAFL